jgi:hypothetical protein
MMRSSLSPEQLRQQIRLRLAHGRLPPITVSIYRARKGRGRHCLVCRREIGPTQIEYEAEGVGGVLIAHEVCDTLWREESRVRRGTS